MIDSTTLLGLVAGSLTSLCVLPQIYQIWKRRSAKDVSYKMFFVLTLGVSLWVVYGILKDEIAIIITNSMTIFLNIILMSLKWKFRKG